MKTVKLLIVVGAAAVSGSPNLLAQTDWADVLPNANTKVVAAGKYAGAVQWNLESFSPLCLEPSITAVYAVEPRTASRSLTKEAINQLTFRDTKPGLKKNADGPPFYSRADGSITAYGWVPSKFGDVKMSGEVNTAHGVDGQGAASRQGLLARWDQGNNFLWFYVNFASGTYGIMRSRYFGVMEDLPNSQGKIQDFSNTKSYRLEFEVVGDKARGKVYDYEGHSAPVVVGDTGYAVDTKPALPGVAGVLAELALEQPFTPLEGSFANIRAAAVISGGKRVRTGAGSTAVPETQANVVK